MIHTDTRKLQLAGWLKEHGNVEYQSPLKLQKFLLLYEAFAKVDKGDGDFSHLKGYKRGPVFSQTWGDYTYERTAFDRGRKSLRSRRGQHRRRTSQTKPVYREHSFRKRIVGSDPSIGFVENQRKPNHAGRATGRIGRRRLQPRRCRTCRLTGSDVSERLDRKFPHRVLGQPLLPV